MRNDLKLQLNRPLENMEPSEIVKLLKKAMIENNGKTLADMIDKIADNNNEYIDVDKFIHRIFGSILIFYRWCKLTDELVTAILEDRDYSINHDAYEAIMEIDTNSDYSNDYTFNKYNTNVNDSEYALTITETIFLKEFKDKLLKLRELYADDTGINTDVGLIVSTLGHNLLVRSIRYW